MSNHETGKNTIIGKDVLIGTNVSFGHNCIVEDGVSIGDNCFIDSNTVIHSGVSLGAGSHVDCNCILGEHTMDFYTNHQAQNPPLRIGKNALIRSGSILYSDSEIGDNVQTGHQVTIREKTTIKDNVSIGTLSDVQGNCVIGSFSRIHSNVFVAPETMIDSFVWLFPHVVLTNDPTPPSNFMQGIHIHSFAIVAARAVVLPGIEIGQDSLIGAGTVVTKSAPAYALMLGNPAKQKNDVRNIKNKTTGESAYPWRNHFSKYMPWDGIGFDRWYDNLPQEEKEHFGIVTIQS